MLFKLYYIINHIIFNFLIKQIIKISIKVKNDKYLGIEGVVFFILRFELLSSSQNAIFYHIFYYVEKHFFSERLHTEDSSLDPTQARVTCKELPFSRGVLTQR
jgi:hypothetical protein